MELPVDAFICYAIYIEMIFHVHVRNSYLASSAHRLLEAANKVLLTDFPEKDIPVLEDTKVCFPGESIPFASPGISALW